MHRARARRSVHPATIARAESCRQGEAFHKCRASAFSPCLRMTYLFDSCFCRPFSWLSKGTRQCAGAPHFSPRFLVVIRSALSLFSGGRKTLASRLDYWCIGQSGRRRSRRLWEAKGYRPSRPRFPDHSIHEVSSSGRPCRTSPILHGSQIAASDLKIQTQVCVDVNNKRQWLGPPRGYHLLQKENHACPARRFDRARAMPRLMVRMGA
jgi:hypothetical protein